VMNGGDYTEKESLFSISCVSHMATRLRNEGKLEESTHTVLSASWCNALERCTTESETCEDQVCGKESNLRVY
jgi:hypothetical protein